MFGWTCGDCRLLIFLQAGHGLRPAPGIPCALSFSKGLLQRNSGIGCRENVSARLAAVTQKRSMGFRSGISMDESALRSTPRAPSTGMQCPPRFIIAAMPREEPTGRLDRRIGRTC
jgi:hypothetical protein